MPEETETQPTTSKKREFTATAAALAVTITLGMVAQQVISRASKKVHDQIAPEPNTTN